MLGDEFQNATGREFWDCYLAISKGIHPLLHPDLPLPRFIKRKKARKRLASLDRQLANENFVTRAKPEAVAKVRENAENQRATVAALEEQLAKMG